MVITLVLLCLILGITTLYLLIKIRLMKKSAGEICRQLNLILGEDTNVLIGISSGDPAMRRLAAEINRELRQLRKERRRYLHGDKELKTAVTNISHDLRTPLTAICGYLDLLEEEEKSAEVSRYLAQIQNRAQALKQLTEELFRYSMVLSTKESLQLERVAVNSLLEDSIAACYAPLTAKGIVPEISLPEERVYRNLDPSALSRVFGNILTNAVKYSDGKLSITMDPSCTITFANSAHNLSTVTAAKLFDRFYTVETGRNSTGLGLSIAKALTEEMGGTIEAEYHKETLYIRLRF